MAEHEDLQPQVVLGVAAHPDDLDFSAAGTMAYFAKQGAAVYYLVLTDGSKGSSDRTMTGEQLRDLRREEQRSAARLLGVTEVFFCDYADGALECNQAVKRDVVKYIRQLKPDVVITMDPSVIYSAPLGIINHPDHRAAGQAALDAVYPLARDHMAFPELLAEGFEPHNTKTVLLTDFENGNYAVDISALLDLKFQAIAAHTSQVPADLTEVRQHLTRWAAAAGTRHGYQYAEPFTRIDVRS